MIKRWHEPMQHWSRERGLEFLPDGLLPAWTRVLASGAGAGAHRAALVISWTDTSQTSMGGFTKYPERGHHHLCRGVLPGGLEGVLAHQLHLALDSDSDGESWHAYPTTVVVARLPEGARVAQDLTGRAGTGPAEIKALFELGRGGDRPAMPVAGPSTIQRATHAWTADPAEDPALLAELLDADLDAALALAPPATVVEYRYGGLCVSARGAITDPAALDALCRVAATFAAGMRRAAGLLPALDPAAELPAPAQTPRSQWIDQGVARVTWHTPPASVPEATAAYAQAVEEEAAGSGRSARRIGLGAAFVIAWIALGITLGLGYAFDRVLESVAVCIFFGPFFLYRLFKGALELGREAKADHAASHALPWGLEAFTRGYASTRGMVPEDRDAFRRRFESPVPGTPLKVLRGKGCRLVLWADYSDVTRRTYHLIGVGKRIVAHEVDDAGRSIANLDRLAAEVC